MQYTRASKAKDACTDYLYTPLFRVPVAFPYLAPLFPDPPLPAPKSPPAPAEPDIKLPTPCSCICLIFSIVKETPSLTRFGKSIQKL